MVFLQLLVSAKFLVLQYLGSAEKMFGKPMDFVLQI
jgi:hypothetical protein